jgi:hypothetical protein
MFRVENADFIADKLASELLPNQENREAAKNAEEAILRRMAITGSDRGRIEFDVDWPLRAQSGQWYISCADDGDGMSRAELERYTTTLAVQGANQNQSVTGNQGMGLKISGPTRHKQGVLIRSLKNGERTMVQVGWNPATREYGLIPIGADGQVVVSVDEHYFPRFVLEQGSGTVVTFLGNAPVDNTYKPADRPKGWLFRYLNQRFFRFSDNGIEMVVRVPSGDEEEWPATLEEADTRMKGLGGRSFNLSKVYGTASIWDDASDKVGPNSHGVFFAPGDLNNGQPAANIHWWVLPAGTGSDVSSRTFGGGTMAVLFQNELHDWKTGNQASPYFARMGVLFGKTRISFVVEPLGASVTSDFARAHVLVSGKPVFESDALITWAEQFRAAIPSAVREAMAEEQSRLQADDPDRAKRIKDRLRDVLALLKPQRYRRTADGSTQASGPETTGGGDGEGPNRVRTGTASTRRGGATGRGIGALLSQVDPDGEAANEVYSMLHIEPKWVSEKEAEGTSLVKDEGRGLHDRAAGLVGEDGASAPVLLLNREFRGYLAIVNAISEWANPEGDESKDELIETCTQEWIEQKMVEAVTGLRQLENGSSWTASQFDDALSPLALTAAFMADRYHTLREIKRQLGNVRRTEPVA